jgi:Glycopeptide antibiotics resistance protein
MLFHDKNKKDKFTFIIAILFVVYLAILLRLLTFRDSSLFFAAVHGNFVPFKTILNYLSDSPTLGIAIRNLVGNIIIFVPLGFFVPLLRRSSKWKTVLIVGLIISSIIEVVQGIFRVGIFDVDDILLNTFGAIFGYGTFVYIKLMIKRKYRLNSCIF